MISQRTNSKIQNSRLLFCVVFLFVSFSFWFGGIAKAHAEAALSLTSTKTNYRVGDSFSVSLSLNTSGNVINTISGSISVPNDVFQIVDVRSGSSIISLWVQRPEVDYENGVITFTGGVPGGFGGSRGPIISFLVKAKKTGFATIDIQNAKVLLNDGQGTELSNVVFRNLSLQIGKALPVSQPRPAEKPAPVETTVEVYQPAPDTVSPEHFVPLVSRDPGVADNKYFVSFFAVDKDSGISHYEVREEPYVISRLSGRFLTSWVRSESPYVLQYQWWGSRVFVRAYDQAGNYTDASTVKPTDPVLVWVFVVPIVVAIVLVEYFILRPRRRSRRKRIE